MERIAVIDDQELIRDSLQQTLSRAGYRVESFGEADLAVKVLKTRQFDLVITDLKMPNLDGIGLIRQLRGAGLDSEVIVMTAYGTVDTAVEAMKLGAFDYVQKPFEADQIEFVVSRALQHRRLHRENEALRASFNDYLKGKQLIGNSDVMHAVRDQITRISGSNATVLIEGESGTGKEMVARAIHRESKRSKRSLLCLNCAALSSTLLESELFGHEKGAFTGADRSRKGRFELADSGTLVLDEISEIPVNLQAKLLRVLQEKEFERVGSSVTRQVDVRVIATTNRDLPQWVEEGKFREDLYYRLSVLPIHLPPLRDRKDDIIALAEYFLQRIGQREGQTVLKLDRPAKRTIRQYDWPGNVRELENLMERATVLCDGEVISEQLMSGWLRVQRRTGNQQVTRSGHLLEDMERQVILKTLDQFGGHRQRTAEALGIGLRTLSLKLKRWNEQQLALTGT